MSPTGSNHPRRWQPNGRILVFAGLFLPLLLALGIWQLQRAGEKADLMEGWQNASAAVEWSDSKADQLVTGQPVALSGRYDQKRWLLDNRTRDGRPGYEVLNLFVTTGGDRLLVNRGWIPAPRLRDQLPEVAVPEGDQQLLGRVSDYPDPPVLTAQDGETGSQWPRRVQALPREAASTAAGVGLPPVMIRLLNSEQPGAYRADWTLELMGPQTHYGYALQWFSLAVALVILTVFASYRRTGANNDKHNG